MDLCLTWFARAWIGLVLLLSLADIAVMALQSGGGAAAAMYNPFDLANFLMEAILLSPALAMLIWRNRRRLRGACETAR